MPGRGGNLRCRYPQSAETGHLWVCCDTYTIRAFTDRIWPGSIENPNNHGGIINYLAFPPSWPPMQISFIYERWPLTSLWPHCLEMSWGKTSFFVAGMIVSLILYIIMTLLAHKLRFYGSCKKVFKYFRKSAHGSGHSAHLGRFRSLHLPSARAVYRDIYMALPSAIAGGAILHSWYVKMAARWLGRFRRTT